MRETPTHTLERYSTQNPEQETQDFRDTLQQALELTQPKTLAPELKARQLKVLQNLPEDTLIQLRAHLRAKQLESEEFYNEELSPARLDAALRGEVFEMLVHADTEIMPEIPPEGEELLALLENPDRFGLLKQLGRIRNPDATFVKLNKLGQIIIEGFGEAKMGKLDERSLHQLDKFVSSLDELAKTINGMSAEELLEHGLDDLFSRRAQKEALDEQKKRDPRNTPFMTVLHTQNFRRVLFVPAGRKKRGLLQERALSSANLARLDQIELRHAAFTTNEIALITRTLKRLMKEDEKTAAI